MRRRAKPTVVAAWAQECGKYAARKDCLSNKDECSFSRNTASCVPRACPGRKEPSCVGHCLWRNNRCHLRKEHVDTGGDVCTANFDKPDCQEDAECHWGKSRCQTKECQHRKTAETCGNSSKCTWGKKTARSRKLTCLAKSENFIPSKKSPTDVLSIAAEEDKPKVERQGKRHHRPQQRAVMPPVSRQQPGERTCGYHALQNLLTWTGHKALFSSSNMQNLCQSRVFQDCTIPAMSHLLNGKEAIIPRCIQDLWEDPERALRRIRAEHSAFHTIELSKRFFRRQGEAALLRILKDPEALGAILLIGDHYVAFAQQGNHSYARVDSLPGVPVKMMSAEDVAKIAAGEYRRYADSDRHSFGVVVSKSDITTI